MYKDDMWILLTFKGYFKFSLRVVMSMALSPFYRWGNRGLDNL